MYPNINIITPHTFAASSPPLASPHVDIPPTSLFIADTGCTGHYVHPSAPVTDPTTSTAPFMVLLPDGTSISSNHQAALRIPSLPPDARLCRLFPSLQTGNLLSIGQLCDHGCTAHFDATSLTVVHDNHTILTGHRQAPYGHWMVALPALPSQPVPDLSPASLVPLPTAFDPVPSTDSLIPAVPTHCGQANTIVPLKTIAERVAFYHATLFSPVMSTWVADVAAGHFATWPDLSVAQITKHFPVSVPMHLGHMDQARANTQSTKPISKPELDTNTDYTPTPAPDRTHALFADLHHVTGRVSSDQTGRFPLVSTAGCNYIMVLYDYDANYIHATPLKSRAASDILTAYTTTHQLLVNRGFKPKLQRLDNEASAALVNYMAEQ
jgi:hypothetical protein